MSLGDRCVSSKWFRTSVAVAGSKGTIRCLRPLSVRRTKGNRSRRKSAGQRSSTSWTRAPVYQIYLYARALSVRTGIPLSRFALAYFDDKDYFEVNLQAEGDRRIAA